jgi:UDP-2-acetamido-3-amino-2,3-dideoxy-glucuronate N-acetyltransferase
MNPVNFIAEDAEIGWMTTIWHFATVLSKARIGNQCSVGSHAEVGARCIIGDGSRISAHVFLAPGTLIGQNVFIGPGAVVTVDVPANTTFVGLPARQHPRLAAVS